MSPKSALKRALVTLLLSLARQFDVALQRSRDSPDEQVKKSFKKVVLKIYPDKPRGCVPKTLRTSAQAAQYQARQPSAGAQHTPISKGAARSSEHGQRIPQSPPQDRLQWRRSIGQVSEAVLDAACLLHA